MLATCSLDGIIRIYEAPDVMNISHWSIQYEINCSKACSSVSWNPSLYRQNCPMLAVGSDDSNANSGTKIFFYELSDQREWQRIVDKSWPGITDLVHDISFAPNVGRSYDLLGVATTKDVKVIALNLIDVTENQGSTAVTSASSVYSSNPHSKRMYNVRVLAAFQDHGSQAWRVSWNITGTILASSGDDGAVRLWKGNNFFD